MHLTLHSYCGNNYYSFEVSFDILPPEQDKCQIVVMHELNYYCMITKRYIWP